MSTSQSSPHGRARRVSGAVTPARAALVVVVYAVIFMTIQLASGVDYDELTDSASNLFLFVVLPVGLGVLAVGALTIRWGATTEILREEEPLRRPRFLVLLPMLMVLYGVIGLIAAPWEEWTASLVLLILVGTILVGIGEELVFRGWVLVGARKRFGEVGAWFTSSALFGLFHGLNLLTGQSVGLTVQQVVFAFGVGSAFYLVRRWSGTLLVPMALHALWDCSTFLFQGRGSDDAGVVTSLDGLTPAPVMPLLLLVTIISIVVVLRHHQPARPAATA